MPINDGPFHVVAKAALRHFVGWVEGGDAAAGGAPLELTAGDAPVHRRDADGIALGGVRTPPVDVPVARPVGRRRAPATRSSACCSGRRNPMPAERLAELYPSRADFEQRYDAAVDEAIDAGFVLEEDRAALDGYAHPELVTG